MSTASRSFIVGTMLLFVIRFLHASCSTIYTQVTINPTDGIYSDPVTINTYGDIRCVNVFGSPWPSWMTMSIWLTQDDSYRVDELDRYALTDEWWATLYDFPSVGHCYRGHASGTDGSFSQESATGQACWSGPPPPPPNDQCDPATNTCSPIIFNLANGDYQLTGADDPVLFDIAGSGTLRRIGWTAVGADEAFLWLDRNHNGKVDNGSELFGNATPLRSGQRAPNGFVALAEFDSNGDGVIDADDPIWNPLLLWVDRNHDGISQPDEIQPIAESSITGIELSYHWTGRHDQYGNLFRYEGHLREGRCSRTFYDIFFVTIP